MRAFPLFVAALLAAVVCGPVTAADPATGTVSPAAPQTEFTMGPYLTSTGLFCSALEGCDSYELTAELPADYATTHPDALIRFGLGWAGKLDLFVFEVVDADSGETLQTSESTDLGSQTIYLPAGAGTRRLRLQVTPAAPNNSVIHGTASLSGGEDDGLRPNPVGPGVPRYQVYAPPAGLSGNTGEPSTGYNPASKQSFILSGLKTLWLRYPQDLDPPLPQACEGEWAERSSVVTSVTTLDPIGITDSLVRGHETTRTIIGQLAGANSAAAYTDDDGETWIPVEGGPPVSAIDHQTYGAGPYPASHPFGITGNPVYPNAVYYCGQDIGFASCARSDNGGISFGPATLAYTVQQCAGIHGHVRVAPDGTVYLPGKSCGTGVAVTVSEDAGTTWTVRPVPGSRPAIRDPSVALATDSTAYFCYSNGDGRATVSVTRDRGRSWDAPVELGADMGVRHTMFTHALAGDPDRAVCAYLGTTTEGNPVALDFPGVWHLYFSTTYDGGRTWTTVNATPDDPVQGVGGIWNSGGSSLNRNLLDFNEMSIDERGYPMYGYADGCIGDCDIDPALNSFAAFPKIARQVAGKSLYAAFDAAEPRAPSPACLSGLRTPERTQLNWRVPENGGAAIAGYKIYRGLAPGAEELVGATDGTPGYIDLGVDPGVEKYYYKVTAINAAGEGVASNTIELPVTIPQIESVCAVPGRRIVDDAAGDADLPDFDLISLHIAEPEQTPDALIFQIKVASLQTAPIGTMWEVLFNTPALPGSGTVKKLVGMIATETGMRYVHGSNDSQAVVLVGYQEVTIEGDLDPASGYSPDGTIQLVVPRSVLGVGPGDTLSGLMLRTHTGATDSSDTHLVRSTNTLDTATATDGYTLRATDGCLPNTAPFAVLAATPARGAAPLTVRFDAAASHDNEDAIVEYVFDFGDQTAQVVQATPTVTHHYAQAGFYRATLQVQDARGKLSENVAQAVIDTTGSSGGGGSDAGRFGGAFGGGAVWLLLLAALRRRRGIVG
ncbi:PKD domain-containing protein [Fontimonas sp. SYSU GA230001]|uniref:PKD domain-containing protein n=1 Tax=Fontimonas sp. SYSU GA230001 TaxID=3142450 RepID=UPI0032B619A5